MSDERITVYVLKPKDRSQLQLQWLDPTTAQRKTKSAGTADPNKAREKANDLEFRLNNGQHEEASKLEWDRFRELFEQEHVAGLRASTREKYTCVLDVFEQIINPAKLKVVNERAVSLFVKGMRERKIRPSKKTKKAAKVGLAPATIRNYLIALKKALSWAAEQHFIPRVPAFPKIKVPKKKPSPVPVELFERLLEKAPDTHWRAYLLCGWWSGLRLSEAKELRWQSSEQWPWIDFEGSRLVLPAVFVKAGQDQTVPLHPVLRQALAELPRTGELVFPFRSRRGGGRLSRNGITNRVLDMAKRAGVKLSYHRLRKAFGCRVAKQLGKGRAPILHELLRHSSMQVSLDYYVNVSDVLNDAMNELT